MNRSIYSYYILISLCVIICQLPCYSLSVESDLTVESDLSSLVEYWNTKDANPDSTFISEILESHINYVLSNKNGDDLFLSISNHFYEEAMYEEGLRYFELFNLNSLEPTVLKGQIYYHLGRFYNALNDKNKTVESLDNALDLVCDSPYLYRINSEFLQLYAETSEFSLAKEFGLLALKLCDQYHATDEELYRIHELMTIIYSGQKDYEKMDYHIEKIKYYSHQINTSKYFQKEKLTLAGYFLTTGRSDKGRDQLDQLKSVEALSNALIHKYHYLQGLSYMWSQNYTESIKAFKQALNVTKGVRPHRIAMTHSWLANCYDLCINSSNTISEKYNALELYHDSPDKFNLYLHGNYLYLGSIYKFMGDLQKSLDNYQKSKVYAKDNLAEKISINRRIILLYGELLKDEYSKDNLNDLFTIMNETHHYIIEWNFNRHYIDNDMYRDTPIKNFYKYSLEVLHELYQYTNHSLIAARIINYTNSLQSIIYANNKAKFDPYLEGLGKDKLNGYEKLIKKKIYKIKTKIKQNIDTNFDIESNIHYLDSLDILKEEYKQIVISKSPYAKEVLNSWSISNAFIKDVQRNLKTDEVLISYSSSNRYIFSTVISKDNVSFFSKDLTPEVLKYFEDYKLQISHDPLINFVCYEESRLKYNKVAYALYQLLIKDEIESLVGQPKHLIIIPDNLVQSLPFNALLTEIPKEKTSFKDYPYLIDKYSIAYDFSLQSFMQHKNKKRKEREYSYVGISPNYEVTSSKSEINVLAKDDSSNFDHFVTRGGVVNLPGAKKSVLDISSQLENAISLIDSSGTKKKLNFYLEKTDIIHLAMHAVIDPENPEFSQFIFSESDETLNLHAYELFDMNLDTELAMLSACDTGKGEPQSGKSLQSISQAFSFAGAASLTTSFYKIPDSHTALIDNYFITQVNNGVRLDEALRLSNLDYLEKSSEIYAHPFYWAGIALSGKTEPLKGKSKSFFARIFM